MNQRDFFKLKVHESDGAKYQDLFTKIMGYAHQDFRAVKPHGNIGDRGNDGWRASIGRYYQVYAPEDLRVNTKEAQDKVKADFKKLKEFWSEITPIKSFFYVLNDKFKGVSPHISKTLSEIKSENGLDSCGVFNCSDLETELFRLPQDIINAVLGIESTQPDPQYEDRKKVREFVERFSFAFHELFISGGEAGYFFPANVFYDIGEFFGNDWNFERIKSKDSGIAKHQEIIKKTFLEMRSQIAGDDHYEDIGKSFKYTPPFETPNRDALIEQRKKSMRDLVANLRGAYEAIKGYAA